LTKWLGVKQSNKFIKSNKKTFVFVSYYSFFFVQKNGRQVMVLTQMVFAHVS